MSSSNGAGWRSPICAIPVEHLDPIQRGTLAYTWKGVPCLKNPFDLAIYAQLLWRARPQTIIEIGSNAGGSAIWFADMLAAQGIPGRVISIDINLPDPSVQHAAVEFRRGDALQLGDALSSDEMRRLPRPLFVVEDSAHLYEVSLACLQFFDQWLNVGEYICVEDGIITSFDVQERYHGGPTRALEEFLAERGGRYEIDAGLCDYFGYNATWNTNGFLRRV